MKAKMFITGILILTIFAGTAFGQKAADTKWQEIKIKTSAQCGMCKDRIESALAYEKGVKKSDLNITDKIVTVTYDSRKTSPEKIRALLSKTGYDADDVAADKAAYDALPACCKKKTTGCQPGCKH